MEKELELILEQFPKLKSEMTEMKYIFKDEIEIVKRIQTKGLTGNEELILILRDDEEVAEALKLPLQDTFLFKEYLGAFYDKR